MKYAYRYTSNIHATKDSILPLFEEVSKYAQVKLEESSGGWIITCGLGDHDELDMLEHLESNLKYNDKTQKK